MIPASSRTRCEASLAYARILLGFLVVFLNGDLKAAGPLFPMNLQGREYDVYVIPAVGGVYGSFKAINNRQVTFSQFGMQSVATVAGVISGGELVGYAGIHSPEAGTSFLRNNIPTGEYSIAEDISDTGVVIGWERTPPQKSFIWSSTNGLQYLADLYPQVRVLADTLDQNQRPIGTQAYRINRDGLMIIRGAIVPGLTGHEGYYWLTMQGELTPLVLDPSQGLDLNNLGQLPPPGPALTDNLVHNDSGGYAGVVYDAPGSFEFQAARNGQILENSRGAQPNAINNQGYVTARPGLLWSPNGTRVDLRQAFAAAAAAAGKTIPGFNSNGLSDTFINDAGDFVWGNLFAKRVCPEVSLRAQLGTGFEVANGVVSVRVGTRFKATAIIQNVGRFPVQSLQVEFVPPSSAFRPVGGPVPPLPAQLDPGQTVQPELEWEALETGVHEIALSLQGFGECGPLKIQLRPLTVHFLDAPLGIRFDLDPPTDPTNQVHVCQEFDVVATVTNLTSVTLTNVAPLSPPTNGVGGVIIALGNATPASYATVPPGGVVTFRWPMRGDEIGDATLNALFSGTRDGLSFRVGPTVQTKVTVSAPLLVVNALGDEPDADLSDQCADVDLEKPGLQTTLRAAIQTANLVGGTNVILFDLPSDSDKTIVLHSPLPPVMLPCEIQGTSQPGGGWVGLDGGNLPDKTAALELRGGVKVSGLAISTSSFKEGVGIWASSGNNTIVGCRFGLNVRGDSASSGFGIKCSAGGQQIGGSAAGEANIFRGGLVGVLALKLPGGSPPTEIVVEGNRFGTVGAGKSGPDNAIVFGNVTNSRIGGLTPAARNTFVGSKAAAVVLIGSDTSGNQVIGNWFGLSETGGPIDLSNWNGSGVAIALGAHHNQVGGSSNPSRNVISGSDDAGVLLTQQAHDNLVLGNWIGLTADGTGPAENGVGVWALAGANNRIGGITPGQRNIISGNRTTGVRVGRAKDQRFDHQEEDPGTEPSIGTVIEGNWIGLDPSGTHLVPNGRSWNSGWEGISILRFANGTLIGGNSPGRRNVISGNEGSGILVDADPATVHGIMGNNIGTSVDGLSAVPNRRNGIVVVGEPVVTIGGTNTFEANRIAHNAGVGVDLVRMKGGVPGLALLNNLIYDNATFRSIALTSRPAANDVGDGDNGPNGLQNWPLPRAAVNGAGVTLVALDLSSFARNAPVRLDVFQSSGGGGKVPIGSTAVITGTDPKDRYLVEATLQLVGTELTALATTADGTSEFSPPVKVVSGHDGDGDGVPDALERQVPVEPSRLLGAGDPSPGDRNGDDIQDELQPNVASVQVLPVSTNAPWLTVAATNGRSITDLIALTPEALPSLPGQQEVNPAAARFRLGGGTSSPEAIQIWLPPEGPAPTVWVLNEAVWTQLSGVAVQTRGTLRCVAFNLPAAAPNTDWTVALVQPWTPAPSLYLIAGLLERRALARPDDEPLPGYSWESPVSQPSPEGWVLPVELLWPTDPGQWQLQTSQDLERWDHLEVPLRHGESTLQLAFPPTEPVRFFRWRHQ